MRQGRLIAGVCVLAVSGCGAETRAVTQTETVTQTQTQIVTRARTVTRAAAAARPAPPSTAAATTPAATTAAQPAASAANGLTVHDFNGNSLAVKTDGVTDPATPANQYLSPAAGTRFVAVGVTLTDQGPGTISSDANVNMTAIGSDEQAYTPQFGPVNQCTNFSHGQYTLLSGGSERGCVVFDLPDGVHLKAVQFSLGDGTAQFNAR